MNKPILVRKDKHLKKPYINDVLRNQLAYHFLSHESEPKDNDDAVALAKFEINTLRLWESRYLLRKRIQRRAKQIQKEASV